MPNPNNYKDQKTFMKACVPMVMDEGTAKDNKQAVAMCFSMWKNRKKKTMAERIVDSLRDSQRDSNE